MHRCSSRDELSALLVRLSGTERVEMMVEDYLDIRHEYSLLGLCTKNGTIGPGFFVAEKGGHDERRGVAMTGIVLTPSAHQELVDKLIRFMSSLNYEGLFDIDLIETADGKMYFTEVNFRYGASGHVITQCGANLPGMLADYMLFGRPVDLDCTVTQTGKRFASEKILFEEYTHGYIRRSEIRSCMDTVDCTFIRNKVDPRPYRHFRLVYCVAPLLKSFYLRKRRIREQEERAADAPR